MIFVLLNLFLFIIVNSNNEFELVEPYDIFVAQTLDNAFGGTPNTLEFFEDVLQYTPQEIEDERQDAITFFKNDFGLDFTNAPETGNNTNTWIINGAILFPYFSKFTPEYTVLASSFAGFRIAANLEGGFQVRIINATAIDDTIWQNFDNLLYGMYSYQFFPMSSNRRAIVRFRSQTLFRLNPLSQGVVSCIAEYTDRNGVLYTGNAFGSVFISNVNQTTGQGNIDGRVIVGLRAVNDTNNNGNCTPRRGICSCDDDCCGNLKCESVCDNKIGWEYLYCLYTRNNVKRCQR